MNNKIERWEYVNGYVGRYSVSNFGRIKTLKYKGRNVEKILKEDISNTGYKRVRLYSSFSSKNYSVHRLVANAFLCNPLENKQVNHKDGNKTNNTIENLEWCTASENIKHAIDTGLLKVRFGDKHHGCKKICMKDKLTLNTINIFPSVVNAHLKTGLNKSAIQNAARGLNKTCGGYVWEYYK